MTWISENKLSWIQQLAVNILKCGQIPKHIAFIMDGNRRFAVKNNLKSKCDGHVRGFDILSLVLQWCQTLGISEVTVYAFSIENFKRGQEEVNTLLELVREKLGLLMAEREKLNERGISIRIIGNLSLLPLDIQKLMANAVLMTKHNDRAILNIAFAYTARDEITESVRKIINGIRHNDLQTNDISTNLIRHCMYTSHSPDPDLLIRTSGEARLSDFMLSQISTTIIYFSDILWPEFTFWNFLAAVFYYQRYCDKMIKTRAMLSALELQEHHRHQQQIQQSMVCSGKRVTAFVAKVQAENCRLLENLLLNDTFNIGDHARREIVK